MKKLILLLALSFGAASIVSAQQAAIIAHPTNALESLSTSDLEAILTGNKKQWSGGGNIEIAILKGGPAHEEVVQTYAKKSAAQFKSFWRNLVFSGRGVMPREFDNASAMIQYVAATPNAIGYVEVTAVDASVKVFTISR